MVFMTVLEDRLTKSCFLDAIFADRLWDVRWPAEAVDGVYDGLGRPSYNKLTATKAQQFT